MPCRPHPRLAVRGPELFLNFGPSPILRSKDREIIFFSRKRFTASKKGKLRCQTSCSAHGTNRSPPKIWMCAGVFMKLSVAGQRSTDQARRPTVWVPSSSSFTARVCTTKASFDCWPAEREPDSARRRASCESDIAFSRARTEVACTRSKSGTHLPIPPAVLVHLRVGIGRPSPASPHSSRTSPMRADLPMPWPDATAICSGRNRVAGSRMIVKISRRYRASDAAPAYPAPATGPPA